MKNNNDFKLILLLQSYEEEELAAAWDSCARLSCLEHGFTIHSSFDLVPPYPRFEPRISMKCDSSVVINTGNLLHCLNFDLEKVKHYSKQKSSALINYPLRFAAANFQHQIFSPPHAPSVTSDSDLTSDCESEFERTNRRKKRHYLSEERLQRVAEFAEQLSPPNPGLRYVTWHGIKEEEKNRQRILMTNADKAYDMTDENIEKDLIQEKNLSTFRRKRLAEKKYAFTEEDNELIPFRKQNNRYHCRFFFPPSNCET